MSAAGRACWSCRGLAGAVAFCPTCGIIQPPDPVWDPFRTLGARRSFEVDLGALEEAYRERQQLFHPDRFATRSAVERRYSLEHVTRLNEAWQSLRDPLHRAVALLELEGYRAPAGERPGHDPGFLMEVMELRERLETGAAGGAGAAARLDGLRTEVEGLRQGELGAIGAAFHAYFGMGEDGGRLAVVARHVGRLRYYDRFLEELERAEEGLLIG